MKMNNVCTQINSFLFTVVLSIFLAACGGGGGGGNNPTSASASQGVLVDAAVEGIRYETTTQSGLTDATGTFNYLPGEVVKFYIGDILLGSATGAGMLTPIDLVSGAMDETDPQVTNILRFLQSLDSDTNLANGIQISSATRSALNGQSLNFTLAESDFENAFNTLSGSMLGGVALVASADAQAHMRAFLDTLTGGGGSGGSQGLGSVTVSGTDTGNIGSSYAPTFASPSTVQTATSVSWIDLSSASLGISAVGNQLASLTYVTSTSVSGSGNTFYSYSIICWPVAAAECSKITLDITGKRLVLNNAQLAPTSSSVLGTNLATGPITLNGTLYWK